MNPWHIAIIVYVVLALGTFIPVLTVILRGVKLHPGGPSFDESSVFSSEGRGALKQNFERLRGTLSFWKNRASQYHACHLYCLAWIIPSTVLVPILAQAMSADNGSKWMVTIVSAHAALLIALYRGFKIEQNYKSFRNGESEFYDLYRRLLDRPQSFGETENEQLDAYFEQVELVRKYVRLAEIDNFPSIEEVTERDSGRKEKLIGKPKANAVTRPAEGDA